MRSGTTSETPFLLSFRLMLRIEFVVFGRFVGEVDGFRLMWWDLSMCLLQIFLKVLRGRFFSNLISRSANLFGKLGDAASCAILRMNVVPFAKSHVRWRALSRKNGEHMSTRMFYAELEYLKESWHDLV